MIFILSPLLLLLKVTIKRTLFKKPKRWFKYAFYTIAVLSYRGYLLNPFEGTIWSIVSPFKVPSLTLGAKLGFLTF